MISNSFLDLSTSVHFNKQIAFSASQDLANVRSQVSIPPHSPPQVDPWNLKPPDFSPKLYISQRIPLRKIKNTQESSLTFDFRESDLGVDRVTSNNLLPVIDHRNNTLPKFNTLYKPPCSLETKLVFVRTGKHSPVAYKNPKPHNFRPLADYIPDMITAADRDPGDLNFKLQHLITVSDTGSSVTDIYSRDTLGKMDTYKPKEPRWDARLTLPKLPWPPKSASYTRHRRRQGVYSAFMDRVEEKISNSWKTG